MVKRAIESQLDEYTFRKIPSPSIQSLYLHQELLVPLSYNLEQQERLQIATLPRHTLACIETHQDEVWDVKFSPSGNFLASTSKDRLVCIWKMNLDESRNGDAADLYFQINDQAKTPHVLAWAPDEQSLLSCSNETSIMQWDMRVRVSIVCLMIEISINMHRRNNVLLSFNVIKIRCMPCHGVPMVSILFQVGWISD